VVGEGEDSIRACGRAGRQAWVCGCVGPWVLRLVGACVCECACLRVCVSVCTPTWVCE